MPKHEHTHPQRLALTTGANRGIGLETARQLARRGFHVVMARAHALGYSLPPLRG